VKAAIVIGVLGALTAPLGANDSYEPPTRVDYLAHALAAVRGLGADGRAALDDALYQGARRACHADQVTPAIACQLELARATCTTPDCALAADVILTNQRSENEFVDEATRMNILGSAADFHVGLRAELANRYAALAADFALAAPGADAELPARIDRFCSHREQDPSWQRCAAALIWWIGENT
jgi:hypothetical protein